MKSLRLRPQALADLDAIWLYIAEDNMQAADGVIDNFTETFRLLCVTPHMGTLTPQLAEDLRRFPTRGYVIFYSVTAETLVVERVLHGARDIEALLD